MNEKTFLRIMQTLRSQGSELQRFECKSATFALPKKLVRTLSAFANQEDGGTILLGVGDAPDFEVHGVQDMHALQSELSSLIQERLVPAPQVTLHSIKLDDKRILVVQVAELPQFEQPCYDKRYGLHGGAYKRVGDQDQLLSPYEIFLLQANRNQPHDDIRPVAQARYDQVQARMRQRLEQYAEAVRKKTRSRYLFNLPDPDLLQARHLIEGNCLSLMGLLCFEDYPQKYFPKLRITFLSFADENKDSSVRYLDNKIFEGPLEEMLVAALQYIRLQLPETYRIQSHPSKTQLQLPELALREALLNALVHRDYSPMALGREIQIRLTPRQLEIENPGGLFGGTRIDTLKTHQSICRNTYLATLLEDLEIIENRGDGILAMCQAMKDQDLPEPIFMNLIDSFRVVFYRSSTARGPLSPEAFFEAFPEFRRRDVIEALSYTLGEAKYFIQTHLKSGRIRVFGRGRATRYRVR